MINGRSFPDTVAPNGAAWLPNQPYGSLIHIHPYNDDPGAGDAYNPYPALIRYLNVGTENYPHHPHGNHGRIIARDGNVLVGDGRRGPVVRKVHRRRRPGRDLRRAVRLDRRGRVESR